MLVLPPVLVLVLVLMLMLVLVLMPVPVLVLVLVLLLVRSAKCDVLPPVLLLVLVIGLWRLTSSTSTFSWGTTHDLTIDTLRVTSGL